jgi:hypothetical protein
VVLIANRAIVLVLVLVARGSRKEKNLATETTLILGLGPGADGQLRCSQTARSQNRKDHLSWEIGALLWMGGSLWASLAFAPVFVLVSELHIQKLISAEGDSVRRAQSHVCAPATGAATIKALLRGLVWRLPGRYLRAPALAMYSLLQHDLSRRLPKPVWVIEELLQLQWPVPYGQLGVDCIGVEGEEGALPNEIVRKQSPPMSAAPLPLALQQRKGED